MTIVFPHGHAYDFEKLKAGITALRNASPTNSIRGNHYCGWKSDSEASVAYLSIIQMTDGVHVEIPWGKIETFTEVIEHWHKS